MRKSWGNFVAKLFSFCGSFGALDTDTLLTSLAPANKSASFSVLKPGFLHTQNGCHQSVNGWLLPTLHTSYYNNYFNKLIRLN